MKPQENRIDLNEFQELHKHKGSENYEVVELFVNKTVIKQPILVDKINENVIVSGHIEDELNERKIFEIKKISTLGKITATSDLAYRRLKDGTLWYPSYYLNWVINGDTTEHNYIDPFSNQEIEDPYEFTAKEKDPEKWLEKFNELYAKAQYVYENSFYYFKIENKWYLMDNVLEGIPEDLEEQYPPKEDQDVRMVALQDLSPKYFIAPNERDTQLIREMGYESTEYQEIDKGLISYGYSAGWWYLEVYMPLGDIIKIKRFSSFKNPDLQLYSIPNAYGGRQDVLFLVQEPKNMHASQVAGMYVIRPKNPKQPQRRYSLIKYKRDKDGFKFIDKEESVESEEYKAWVKKTKK